MSDHVYLVMGRFSTDGAQTVVKAFTSEEHAQAHVKRITQPHDASDDYYSLPSSAEMVGLCSVWIERVPVT
ncbi:hypothetical protein LCGC14_0799130 [marine sediment metagenome]|uniref:Uncharacterized protein n=1 Tax=marine sediment metagenome TaxID=412755 RepID=A0A0F9PQ50_9ZZZZ